MNTLRCAAAIAALAVCARAQCLSTLYATNNSGSTGGAVYFDITLQTGLTITSLQTNFGATGAVGLDVYLTAVGGTHAGNESNAAAWTLAATDDGTAVGAGLNLPTTVTLQVPLFVGPGSYGVALVAKGDSHRYTNGTGTNQVYSDAALTITTGTASNLPFTPPVFTPRVWNGAICYTPGAGFARAIRYGTGCGGDVNAPSIHEQWLTAGSFDLSNTSYIYTFTGNSYAVAPTAASIVAPVGSPLTIGDDVVVQVRLPFAMQRPGGPINSLWIDSNGRIGFESIATDLSEAIADLLNGPSTLAVVWDDLNPGVGGTVHAEQDPNDPSLFHVTFTGVPEFSVGGSNDFQVTFSASGSFLVKYGTCSVGDCIAGYSPGSGSAGAAIDFTADLPRLLGTGRPNLSLVSVARPRIGTTSIAETRSIVQGATVGVLVAGLSAVTPPFDFAPIGAPGCFWLASADATVAFPIAGSTVAHPLPIPNDPGLAGASLFLQTVVVSPTYNAAAFGTSNGLEYVLDVN